LKKFGPGFGYFANPAKSWLLVKDSCYSSAMSKFEAQIYTSLKTVDEFLGSPIGSPEYVSQFLCEKIGLGNWILSLASPMFMLMLYMQHI
jgi:hypothetical protein